jgi:hypothetical protein
MTRAFLLGIRLYLRWFLQSLCAEARRRAPFTVHRILVLLLVTFAFGILQLIHWIALFADELLFRGYRKIQIQAPLFISGIPRSGTTFVHRFLQHNIREFSSFTTWEVLFAPAISERVIICAIARFDRLLGRPFNRLLSHATILLARLTDEVHPVRLDASEEDYLSLLPIGGCFIGFLLFPGSKDIWKLAAFEKLPVREQTILLDFYHRCLQRHLWFHGKEKRLLSKNAAFGTWLPSLQKRYPDAQVILCIRPPRKALQSNLSSLRSAISGLGNKPAADWIESRLTSAFADTFPQLLQLALTTPQNQLAILDQPALRTDPVAELARILSQLKMCPIGDLAESIRMDQQTQPAQQAHRHTWFNEFSNSADFDSRTEPVYEQMRSFAQRSQPSSNF